MNQRLKPPLVGPIVRSAVFAFVAFVAAKGPFTVMANETKEHHAVRPPEFWPLVWGSSALVVTLCAYLVFRIMREAFPPKGTHVFNVLPVANITIVDLCVAPFSALFLLILGLLPQMWVNPMGQVGLREMDLMQLLILVPMGAVMLLWRPTFHLTEGGSLTRHPMGGWSPWKQVIPVRPKLVWDSWSAGKPRRVVGLMLSAKIEGLSEFALQLIPLGTPPHEQDAITAEWAALMASLRVDSGADVPAVLARLRGKPVKPWHILAAMFGLPALVLSLSGCFQPHRDNASMGFALLAVAVTGALSLWFISRFLTQRGLLIAIGLLALVALGGALRGRARGEVEQFSWSASNAMGQVCEGTASRVAPTGAALRFASKGNYTWNVLKPEQELIAEMPRRVACLTWVTVIVEAREVVIGGRKTTVERLRLDAHVDLREAASGTVVTSRVFEGGEPAAFPAEVTDWRPVNGTSVSIEEMTTALSVP